MDRKPPGDSRRGVKRSTVSPFTSAAASFPPEISLLKEQLSSLSPIDHSSWRGRKSLRGASPPHPPLPSAGKPQKKNKDLQKTKRRSCVKRYSRRSQLPHSERFCPPVAPIVRQMCAPPPPKTPPACDLRQARGRILGNFSLASSTVDRGAFFEVRESDSADSPGQSFPVEWIGGLEIAYE